MMDLHVGAGGLAKISEALALVDKMRAKDDVDDDRSEMSCDKKMAGMMGENVGVDEAEPIVIRIAPGVYHEHLEILQPFVTLCGAGADKTVITGNLGAYEILEDGLKRGTFRTQTAVVHTHDVTMRNLTIENTAGPGHVAGQAIALYADGDRLLFENVHLKGFQDTLFTGPLPPKEVEPGGFRGPLQFAPRINGRQYYRNCRIEGSVDFIFGSATAYFEGCTLVSRDEYGECREYSAACLMSEPESSVRNPAREETECVGDAMDHRTEGKRNSKSKDGLSPQVRSYVAAPSTLEGQEYGYVFVDCVFTGDCPEESCYLGRPWREYAKVVLINCRIGRHIRPEGWHDWGKVKAHETAYFAEYGSCYEGICRDVPGGLRRHLQKELLPLYEKERVFRHN